MLMISIWLLILTPWLVSATLGTGIATGATTAGEKKVLIFGSANADIFVPIERFPEDGETILASNHSNHAAGGKGANQAVSASLLNAETLFACRLGDDDNGKMLTTVLK